MLQPKKNNNGLTDSDNKILLSELTKYANEGASDDELIAFKKTFISEKKKSTSEDVSTSAVPETKSDLAKATGSSGGSKYRLPEQQAIPKDKLDAPDLYGAPQENSNANYKTKTTYINPATGKTYKSTSLINKNLKVANDAFNYAKANLSKEKTLERLNDEIDNNQWTDKISQVVKGAYNTSVAPVLSAANTLLGGNKDFYAKKYVPLEREKKQALEDLQEEKKKDKSIVINDATVNERAKQLFIEKDTQEQMSQLIDKALPSGYDREGVWKELKLEQLRSNDVLRSAIASVEVYKAQVQEFDSFLKKVTPEEKKKGLSKEKFNDYITLLEKAKTASKGLDYLAKNFDNYLNKANSDQEKLELFKYNYNDFEKNTSLLVNSTKNIVGGTVKLASEASGYIAKKTNQAALAIGSDFMSEISSEIMNEADKDNAQFYRYKASSINNWSDLGSFSAQLGAEQIPILASIYLGGTPGILAVSASSGGQKINELEENAKKPFGKIYSDGEKLLAGLLYAGAEYFPEKFGTARILKDLEKTVSSASTASRKMFTDSFLKTTYKGLGKTAFNIGIEGGTELITAEGQITIDQELLGIVRTQAEKNEMRFESGISGGLMGGVMTMTGGLIGLGVTQSKLYSDKKDIAEVQKIFSNIKAINDEIENNQNLTDKERQDLYQETNRLNNEAFSIVEKNAKKGIDLSIQAKSFLVDVTQKQTDLKAKAKEVSNSNFSEAIKKSKIKDLENEFNSLEEKRNSTLNGGYNSLTELTDKEVIRLKDLASRELMQELNPDNTKNITLTDNQISKRAVKILNAENAKKTSEVEGNFPLNADKRQQNGSKEEGNLPQNENTTTQTSTPSSEEVATPSVQSNKNQSNEEVQTTTAETQQKTQSQTEEQKAEQKNLKPIKPIRQLGTGANVYFETEKYRVNDIKEGKVVLNIGEENGSWPISNIEFDNIEEAVAVAKKLQEYRPNGLTNEYNIDKVINNIKQEVANERTPAATTPTDGNVSLGDNLVEQNGASEQQNNPQEGLQSANDGGNIEGKNEPKIDTSGIGTENYKQRKSQIEGRKREITIADGSKVKGQYKVVSSDDILASHNEENFSKTEGYPVNERGETINDRDYERDKNAQAEVSKIAQDYDGRAIQQTPVVTKEGIVVDGNNRVMSRKLAAKKGTDTKYKEALVNEADMYGINPDEISNVKNPIIVFEAENEMPYNTETLAKFNKQDKKEKSSSGKAVEFSKTLSDRAKRQIAEVYDQAERPSDVTSDVKAVKQLRDILLNNNIIQSNEIPRYFDVDKGVMTKEGVSLMENIALGSVFNEQTINTLSLQGMGDIRNKILQSLVGLINNASLEEKYRLGNEISKAIEVIYQLKTTKQSVEEYLDQPDLYGEKFIPNIDEYATILAISDAGFKKWLQNYNSNVGQPDIFKIEDGGITTKRDKTNETITDRKKQIPSNLRSDAEGNADENGQQNGNIEGKIENKPDNKNDVGRENNPEKPAEPEVKPISETSTADELLNWIDKAKKDLDQFGKENLTSVVIPVEIAKLALEAMRLAVIAGKKASEVIKAGIDVVKQSDWYQNLTSTEQKEVENNFIASLSSNERQTQNKINRELSSSLSEKEAFDKFNETIDDGNKLLENKKTPKEILRKNYRAFIKKFTDRQYTAKRLLDKTGLTKTKNLLINSQGASGKAKRVFEEAYAKIYRHKLDIKFKGGFAVDFTSLNREDRATLDKIIQAKRFIAIDENREARGLEPVSHPNFIDKIVSQKYLDELKNQIGDEKFADLENRANEYFKTYKKLLKEVYDSGLINEASYEAMSDVDYQPRVFLQFVTDFNGDLADNSSKNLPDSGGLSQDQIKSMSEGDASALVSNSEWLLSNSISARTKAITNNNINKRFMTEEFPKAKKRFEAIDPKNFKSKEEERFYNYFKELDSKVVDNPIIGITDAGNPKYKIDKAPINFSKMYYYIDGVQHQFFLEDELHQSWNDNLDGIFSGDTKEILSYASGSALVKGIATGNNPAFPIVNTPRDFLFTVTFSDQYSKIVPKAMVQVAKDVFKAIKAIKKDNEIVQKYFEYGGAMDFLSSQGKLKKETLIGKAIDKMISPKTKDISKSIFDKVTLHKISAYSELMFRLGIFQRSIQNQLTDLGLKDISEVTDSQQKDDIYNQAVASARGILDFNQGGAVTKDLEALIPYINVAFQGGRVALNALEKDPVGTTSRILQASTLASSIPIGISLMLIGLNKDDDDERSVHEIYIDAIDGISQYQKSKYMTIVTGKKNEEGQYQFIKIAKAQELTPVMMLTDNIYNNMIRSFANKPKRDAGLIVKDVVNTFNSNVAPVPISSKAPLETFTRIPVAKAYLTYFTGHDFFREQPLDFNLENKPSPSEGMNRKDVEDFYKKLGSDYGLSPIRSKAFVEALITSPDTNPFVGMLYGGAEAVSSNKDMKEIGLKLGKDIYKSTGKRIVGYTSDFNRNIETKLQLEEKIQEVKLKDAIQKKEFKDLAEQIIAKEIGEKEVNDKLKELEPEDRKRFINKIKDVARNKGVDRNLLDIKYERSTEIKALMILHHYGDIFDGSDDSRKKLNEMQRLKGIITPAVIREIQKLRKENNKPAN